MWLLRVALGLAIAAAALLAVSGVGVRFGFWPYTVGLAMLAAAGACGVAAALLAIVGLCIPRIRRSSLVALLAALALGAGAAYIPLSGLIRAGALPPINDITTDTDRPPQFVVLADPGYPGRKTAEQQRKAYPDILPLTLAISPEAAFSRAHAAADAMGWEVVAADRTAGRIEAVATTFWFGFKDDVVIRVAPSGADSRIDVRSKSRVGVGDAGTNAKRIREYLERLRR